MPRGTRQERLFGAACLKTQLEHSNPSAEAGALAIYKEILKDLDLTDDEVDVFLNAHRVEVEQALRSGRRRSGTVDSGESRTEHD